ncbi:MAG: oxidoreductase [Firmicutes bacterium]|nr:oxidoreductase [Bacillota bacterium]
MAEKKTVEIIEFTDPVCTWCWGSEPILRKLETRYGDQLTVKYVMGGLVKDIREFYDSNNDIGGDPERSNKQIAKHWVEASERHGMPVKGEGFCLFSEDYPSTYPQNIAYKAVQMENAELADRFLRRMREASAAEAKQISKQEVLIELASEVGVDIAKFIARLTDGTAEDAFNNDLQTTRQYRVHGFPSYLVRIGEKEVLLRGYQTFEAFRAVIKTMAGDTINDSVPQKSEESVLNFIKKFGRVTPVEIQVALEYSNEETQEIIEKLKSQKLIKLISAGNGFFVECAINPLSCDSDSGFCNR